VAKARELLGWQAKVDLGQGLADTVAWLRRAQVATKRASEETA
jgi:nucleoside-diphosphate-sugar epimerase